MLDRRRFMAGAAAAPLVGTVAAPQARAQGQFATREAALAWLARGGRLREGETFVAGTEVYRWRGGAVWIPDMPNVVPESLPSPQHFGHMPDLRWRQLAEGDLDGANAAVYGPYRDGGSNAINGFLLADRYARLAGLGVCRAVGDFFVRSFIRRRTEDGQDAWPFDFFVERAEDIRVAVFRADVLANLPKDHGYFGSEIAEMVQHEVPPADYRVTLNPGGMGGIVHFNPGAGRFIDITRQFDIKAVWSHSGDLWTNFQTFQTGLNLAASGAAWEGDRIIGQYSYYGSKPSNRGQDGVVAGARTGYYTDTAQPRISGVRLRALVCRAARVRRDENDPYVDSDPSILTAVVGWIDRPVMRVGTFGRTNTPSNMLFLAHWGGRYAPPGGRETLDKTAYAIEETWHPEDLELDVLTPIDGSAHGFEKGWELAAVAGARVGPVTHVGLAHPYWIGVGDLSDAYACVEQRGRVNRKRISVCHQIATGIAPDPARQYYGILCKGSGTSKFETYPGTRIALQRHGTLDVVCEGHTIDTVHGTSEAIRLRQFRGRFDLGDCRIRGAEKAFHVIGGDGAWTARLHDCDGLIHVRNQTGGRLRGPAVGGAQTWSSDPPAPGDLPQQEATIHAQGQIFGTTTRAAARKGATLLAIHPLGNPWHDINAGDRLEITTEEGIGFRLHATGLYVNGAIYVGVTALPRDLPAGAMVTVVQEATLTVVRSAGRALPVRLHATTARIFDAPPEAERRGDADPAAASGCRQRQ
ncbi:MAG: hypothetical protein EP318_06525 [Rhodobacteraceae bacterium]|nr:MAG: hypothetical protein EP318_06525 [Paracoccaceae bacterium]